MSAPSMSYTQEMIMIHRVFRREAAELQQHTAAVPTGDIARARQLADVVRSYLDGLHLHHTGEDDLIWPLLHQRAQLHDDLVTLMERQHEALDGTITAIRAALTRWEAAAKDEDRDAVVSALAEHERTLHEHLADEESRVMPLVEEHLTLPEWEAVGAKGLKATPRDKLFVSLGAVLQDATPAERADFMRKVPLPGRIAWKVVGQRQYRKWRTSVAGAAR